MNVFYPQGSIEIIVLCVFCVKGIALRYNDDGAPKRVMCPLCRLPAFIMAVDLYGDLKSGG